jgi:muconate cycloisomerase
MLHLALAHRGVTPDDYPCDIIGPFFYEDDILKEPLSLGVGNASATRRPESGVEMDEVKVKRYRVR